MKVPMRVRSTAILLCALAALAPACRAPNAPQSKLVLEPAAPPGRPWTGAFLREAVLVADEIAIEGPRDLIDHVVLQQDEETTSYATKTIPAGLWQELVSRPEMGVEVHAQLDGWSLAAFKRITVLQRPGEVPVTVRALGKAFWSLADGSDERRAESLAFQGRPGQ
jgi:hypothetical protein